MSTCITIDGRQIEELFGAIDVTINALEKRAKILSAEATKQSDKIDKQMDIIQQQNEKIGLLGEEIIKLQNQLIEQKTEDTKERRSLWDFLRGTNKEEKPSRIKESTVILTK